MVGNTADWTDVQKTDIDTIRQETKLVVRKAASKLI